MIGKQTAGLLNSNKIGYKKQWQALLKEKGLEVKGHTLRGTKAAGACTRA